MPSLPDDWYSLLVLFMVAQDVSSIEIEGKNYDAAVTFMMAEPQYVIVIRGQKSLEIRRVGLEELREHLRVTALTGSIG